MKENLIGIAELNSSFCELYNIILLSGVVLRFTTAEQDLIWNNNIYHTGYDAAENKTTLVFSRGDITTRMGIEVDNVDVTIAGQGVFNEILAPEFALNGGFDGASVTIYRATADKTRHLFEGVVTDIKPGTYQVVLTVSSELEKLNIQMPRNTYQASCIHTLYDTGCTLLKNDHFVTATVTTATPASVSTATTLGENLYALGVIEFISGANAGNKRTIKQHTTNTINFAFSFDKPVMAGDSFKLYRGCARTLSACQSFGNQDNFRAYPFIPAPEAAV